MGWVPSRYSLILLCSLCFSCVGRHPHKLVAQPKISPALHSFTKYVIISASRTPTDVSLLDCRRNRERFLTDRCRFLSPVRRVSSVSQNPVTLWQRHSARHRGVCNGEQMPVQRRNRKEKAFAQNTRRCSCNRYESHPNRPNLFISLVIVETSRLSSRSRTEQIRYVRDQTRKDPFDTLSREK